ncbi:MAG: hypothetical protein OEY19_13220 [Gammaproteobacteria bacterium]|nr:hypothetical protein [Gammaproteobacteria bacterium]
MRKLIILGLVIGVIGCVANKSQEGDGKPSMGSRTSAAAKTVTIVMPKSTNWCDAEKKCKYIGELSCSSDSGNAVKRCQQKLESQVIKAGGDTLVLQYAGVTPGKSNFYDDSEYYRAYGKAYTCGGKNKNLNTELKNDSPPLKLASLDFRSKEYVQQCGDNNCKPVTKVKSCRSNGGDPFVRCIKKVSRSYEVFNEESNSIVVQNEQFNRMGFYVFRYRPYYCK